MIISPIVSVGCTIIYSVEDYLTVLSVGQGYTRAIDELAW